MFPRRGTNSFADVSRALQRIGITDQNHSVRTEHKNRIPKRQNRPEPSEQFEHSRVALQIALRLRSALFFPCLSLSHSTGVSLSSPAHRVPSISIVGDLCDIMLVRRVRVPSLQLASVSASDPRARVSSPAMTLSPCRASPRPRLHRLSAPRGSRIRAAATL